MEEKNQFSKYINVLHTTEGNLKDISRTLPKNKLDLSPAIKITQSEYNRNPRSSVGTVTNIYTELRMIYEKLHERTCPSCLLKIRASQCREEMEKVEGDFKVYMFCSHCDHRMEKPTRGHFSYNTREGACKACHGLGEVNRCGEVPDPIE